MTLISKRITHLKSLPVDELRQYLLEAITALEARIEDRVSKGQKIVTWMTRTLDEFIEGMNFLNDGKVDAALHILQVLLAICDAENLAKPNLVLSTGAWSNPYFV